MMRVSLPNAMVTSYTYDSSRKLLSVTDPSGRTAAYEYDPASRLKITRDVEDNDISKYRLNIDEESIEEDASDGADTWIGCDIESAGHDDSGSVSISVFPNPTGHMVYWNACGIMVSMLEVYDARGLLVISKNLGGQSPGEVGLSKLTGGAYIFRFVSEDEIHSLEIIKN